MSNTMSEKFTILVIEDNQNDLTCIREALKNLEPKGIEFATTVATSVKEAEGILAVSDHFDLILSDLYLSDFSGIETIQKIQETCSTIPIIAISSSTDEEVIRQIIRLGAQDYLPKSELDPSHLHRVIYAAIERNRLQQSLRALSFTDEMTGLYNWRGFFILLEQQISLARRTGQGFYLFIVDLDYLKTINDTYGHPTGDRALVDVADCLLLAFRHHDIVGRIGGDEFAVIAINATEDSRDRLKKNLYAKFESYNSKTIEPYQLTVSIATSYFKGQSDLSIQELVHMADLALYEDKQISHLKRSGPKYPQK